MRTVLNVLNFVLGGFATTLFGFCHPVSIVLILRFPDPLLLGNHQTLLYPLRE